MKPRLLLRLFLFTNCMAMLHLPYLASANTSVSNDESPQTHYRTMRIDGLDLFYREAGPEDAPVILLLHGFPASSFMYRDLMSSLAVRFRVIAPDYPGFGYSSAPSSKEFAYTFESFTEVVAKFTDQLGINKYAIYVQDIGGPIGFRLASQRPDKVSALIVQNANAYEEGLPNSFWAPVRELWKNPSSDNFEKIREAAMSYSALKWNYTHGVKEPARVSPDNWILQQGLIDRPGNKDIMLTWIYDYRTNLDHYPAWHEYFRKHQPPMLIVWGKNDEIFPVVGAYAYLRDLPEAELHVLDTGHFALEDKGEEIARLMRNFLDRMVLRR